MPRPPSDPSGAKQTVCVTLSPMHLRKLDDIAGARALSRSATVERLIDRASGTTPTAAPPTTDCVHPKPWIDLGGNRYQCGECRWKQGKDGIWRQT